MATTPTNKPIPSEDPRDLKFNAGKIDEVVTSDAHYYTDRFGKRRLTITGVQYTAEEAIRNYGYITMDSFEDGATLTLPNEVLRYKETGEYYRWDGEFPKIVPAGSTPESTGEVKLGAWVSVGDASLRSQLASESGASLIKTQSGITVQEFIDRKKTTISVADYGAVGDWDQTSQTGTDNTAAFQAAINALAALPTMYNGGTRELFVPEGNYKCSNLTIPSSFGFGLQIRGEGSVNTRLYLKSSDATACVLSEIGYIIISDIEMLGALKRNSSTSERSDVLLEVKMADGTADCDVRIDSTAHLGSANTLVKLHGRGFHCAGSLLFFAGTALEIACDVSSWGSGNNTVETGMRNYHLSDNRFDTVGVGVRVTGAGVEKDFINDISFVNNDIYQMDRAFIGTDCTLQHSIFSGNTAIGSFAYGVVEAKRIVNTTVSNNVLRNFYNRNFLPSADNQYMHGIVICSGAAERLMVTGNTMLYNTLHVVSVGSVSNSVTISNNIFEQSYLSGSTALIFRGANCEHLSISGNTFRNATNPTVSVDAINTSVQTSPTFIFKDNHSSFTIGGTKCTYTPVLSYGSTSVTLAAYRTEYNVVGGTVSLSAQFSTTNTTSGSSGDEVIISVPLNPAVDSNITSSFSGGGTIKFTNGGVPPLIRANAVTGGGIVFIKTDGTTLKRGDLTGTYSVIFNIDYKI